MAMYEGFEINEIEVLRIGMGQSVTIQRRRQRNDSSRWVIFCMGNVLHKSCEWEWEPTPSSRTDAFIADTRFDSLDEAIRYWRTHATKAMEELNGP
jgi:hypothetical protein